MAFIVVLSVFNGLENLVSSLFNSFDPDLRIETIEGKSFPADTIVISQIKDLPEVSYMSYVIEENVLLEYDKKQIVATMKAVDNKYKNVTGVDTMMYDGVFNLYDNPRSYAVVGYGIASRLGISLNLYYPLRIWAPVRKKGILMNVENAFNSDILTVSGIFSVQQEYDDKYVIVPINFARNLMKYGNRATSVEIKLAKNIDAKRAEKIIQKKVGKGFVVKNRFEQKQLIYKIMRTEKWAVIAILSFILLVSSFNIIGTMIMLIIEKRNDLSTLHAIGADIEKIRRIFLVEGWLISSIGAVLGLIIGLAISLGQQYYGWLKFPSSGSFATNSYPVQVHGIDVVFVFIVVMLIGYIVAKYPVRFITKKFFSLND
jgi:lipoprotein-releasing system permease protein